MEETWYVPTPDVHSLIFAKCMYQSKQDLSQDSELALFSNFSSSL